MSPSSLPAFVQVIAPGAVQLRLKVVPGSSRSGIAGPLGDRLKMKVAAPPEDGRANKEVVQLLRKWTGADEVSIVSGQTHPEKVALLRGVPADFDWCKIK